MLPTYTIKVSYSMTDYTFTIPELQVPEEFSIWIDKDSSDQQKQIQQF